MPKKRGHNEGSIRKRSDGTWEARYTTGFDNKGKQIQKSVYGKTRNEVAMKLTLALEKLSTGKYIDPSHMKFSEHLKNWLELKRNKIKPNTYDCYEQYIDLHIIPELGGIKLKNLKRKTIQDFYENKLIEGRLKDKGGLSSATIMKMHNIIHSALEKAVVDKIIASNPTKDAELPKSDEKERRVLSLDEQKVFITALAGDRLELAFLIEITTGMRLGEVLALTWDDIYLKEKYLVVRRTLARVKIRDGGGDGAKYKLVPQEPKTEKGKRLIPIPDALISRIEQHRLNQEKEKVRYKEVYEYNNIVFCTQFGTYIQPRNYMRSFYRIVEKAKIPKANVHSLRHTFATRMLEMGESAKVVQELLGHKNITTTLNTYTHVLEQTKVKAISRVNVFLTGVSEDEEKSDDIK
jgi:integrase